MLVMAKVVHEYERQHAVAMEAAWAAASALPSDQMRTPSPHNAKPANAPTEEAKQEAPTDEKPATAPTEEAKQKAPTDEKSDTAPTEETKLEAPPMDEANTKEAAPPTQEEQPDIAPLEENPAEQRCVLVEVVDNTPLANPALAGVPPKPRCRHCRTLLSAGRCVEPECGKEQVDVAA